MDTGSIRDFSGNQDRRPRRALVRDLEPKLRWWTATPSVVSEVPAMSTAALIAQMKRDAVSLAFCAACSVVLLIPSVWDDAVLVALSITGALGNLPFAIRLFRTSP
jgi:hypothetical protein